MYWAGTVQTRTSGVLSISLQHQLAVTDRPALGSRSLMPRGCCPTWSFEHGARRCRCHSSSTQYHWPIFDLACAVLGLCGDPTLASRCLAPLAPLPLWIVTWRSSLDWSRPLLASSGGHSVSANQLPLAAWQPALRCGSLSLTLYTLYLISSWSAVTYSLLQHYDVFLQHYLLHVCNTS